MVLHARYRGTAYIISLKSHSVAVSVDGSTVAAWDRGGRLYSFFQDGVTWRRGLSGTVLEKRHDGGERRRRLLTPAECDVLLDTTAGVATRTHEAIASGEWRWDTPLDAVTAQEARTLLAFVARFDASEARTDTARFAQVYRPVGILPPDQYLSLVVQATEGCSFNSCTFCDLYHDRYRVKTTAEFRAHVGDVLRYLGSSADLRARGVFLGSANALAVPMASLVPMFEVLADDIDAVRCGVYAFVDGFTGQIKHVRDYGLLAQLGLRRVYVGLESGHDPLLAFVRKPGSAELAVETVRAIKAAGVQVGVIVMTGLGGQRFAHAHVEDTVTTLNSMALGAGDMLYFSELVEVAGVSYARLAGEEGLGTLGHDACRRQRDAIRNALRFPEAPPQIATYDIREFVY